MHIWSFCISRCPRHSCRLSNEYPRVEQVMGGRRKFTLGSSYALRRVCLHLGLAEDDIPFKWAIRGVCVLGSRVVPGSFALWVGGEFLRIYCVMLRPLFL